MRSSEPSSVAIVAIVAALLVETLERDIMLGRQPQPPGVLRPERLDPAGNAKDDRAWRHLAPLGNQSARRDDTACADTRPIEHDRAHADQHQVAKPGAMHDCAVPERAIVSKHDRKLRLRDRKSVV